MFEHLFSQASTPTSSLEEAGTRHRIVMHYDELDGKLINGLKPHLDILALRFQERFQWHSYMYPISINQQEDKTELFYTYLQESVLFLPCVSPIHMVKFWKQIERTPRLQALLSQPQLIIQPVPVQPLAGMTSSLLPQPLAAYPEGYERECAYVQIATAIEQLLSKHLKQEKSQLQVSPIHQLIEARGLLKART